MKTLKIFLASSEELKYERKLVSELVTKLNYRWSKYNITIRLNEWEYCNSAMSKQHKQEDYNKELRQSNMCVILFWTRFGMYTSMELDLAYEMLVSDSELNQMRVLFKRSKDMSSELKVFKTNFEKDHIELCNTFETDNQLLKLIFNEIVSYTQRQINEERILLSKKTDKMKKILHLTDTEELEYTEYITEIDNLLNEISKLDKISKEIKNIYIPLQK